MNAIHPKRTNGEIVGRTPARFLPTRSLLCVIRLSTRAGKRWHTEGAFQKAVPSFDALDGTGNGVCSQSTKTGSACCRGAAAGELGEEDGSDGGKSAIRFPQVPGPCGRQNHPPSHAVTSCRCYNYRCAPHLLDGLSSRRWAVQCGPRKSGGVLLGALSSCSVTSWGWGPCRKRQTLNPQGAK